MRIRWFGEPWPLTNEPASVCEDWEYRIDPPAGKRCVNCSNVIEDGDRGIVMAASPEMSGRFVLSVLDPDTHERRSTYVVATHLRCFLRSIIGDDPALLERALGGIV